MVCSFCHHEFDEALTECPYCHRIVEKDAHSLTVEERESFDGATIEVDGTVCGGEGDSARSGEYQERFDDGPAGRADGKGENNGAGLRIHTFHTGSFLFWALLAVLAVLLVFFILPAFFVLALVAAAGFFLYRLLSGF